MTSVRRTDVGRGLDIMNELGTRLLVRRSHQFSKGPVNGDEQLVPLVETKALHYHAVGPLSDSLLDPTDEPIETIRTGFTNTIKYKRLQSR